jgi:hypothetical protein
MQIIQHQELASAQASLTFSALPQTFTDLLIVTSCRTAHTGPIWDSIRFSFNGVNTNQTNRYLYGDGASAASAAESTALIGFGASSNSSTSNTFSNASAYIPNYTAATAKSISSEGVAENNGTTGGQIIIANLWNSTAAITSITLTPNSGTNFLQYSSATLYGITKGSDGIVTVS